MRRVLIPAFLFTLIALAGAACNGDGEEAVAVESIDCSAVASLDSFHLSSRTQFEVSETGIEATPNPTDLATLNLSWEGEMDFVDGGEKAQGTTTTVDGGREETVRVIVVGLDQWIAFEDRPDAFLQGASGGSIPFPPAETCQVLADDFDLAKMNGEPEDVDGVAGMKYVIDGLPSEAFADSPSIGPGADAVQVIKEYNGTLWVANAGYMSKLDLTGHGEYEGGRRAMDVEFFFEYSNVNDVEAEIVAPEPLAGQ